MIACNRIGWFASVALAIGLLSAVATAQSRRGVHLSSSPRIGWGPSGRRNYNYNRYSTGMNNLNVGYRPASGGGVLGASIYRRQSMRVRRSDDQATVGPRATPSKGSTHRRLYNAPSNRIPSVGAPLRPARGAVGLYTPTGAAGGGSSYASVGGDQPRKLSKEVLDEIITSLVPTKSVSHRLEMINGEKAFRQGKYAKALSHFDIARRMSRNSPESLLSLWRSSFALADGAYAKSAAYLRQTLAIVPELPLVHVFPRSFYGSQADYLAHVKKLEDHVQAKADDGDARLILGYLRWRQGKTDQAIAILTAAKAITAQAKAANTLLEGMAAAQNVDWAKPPKMAKAIEYPAAGIRIAMPEGFTSQPLAKMRHIVRATGNIDGGPIEVGLGAYPVGDDVKPVDIIAHAMENWRKSPEVDELALIEDRQVSMAGLPAAARLFTYNVRGKKARALVICFIRKVKQAKGKPIRMGYGMMVKALPKQTVAMIGVVNGVARSAELIDLRRPIDLPVELSDNVITDIRRKYSLRIPKGWSAGHNERGIVINRIDYLLGGAASPAARTVTLDVPDSMTAKACGESAIKEAVRSQGCEIKILSQGPVKVGGLNGYQFVGRKRMPIAPALDGKAAKLGDPYFEVARMVGSPANKGRREFYVLVVTGYDCDVKQVQTVMDKLAAGFTLHAGPTRR